MTPKKCFYVPGETHIHDVARLQGETWVGHYSEETLDTMRARVPGVELRDFGEVLKETEAARVAQYCHPPKQITEESYDHFLNVLPPCAWTHTRGAECFYVSEAWDADLHQWCVKIGNNCWTLTRSKLTAPKDIIAEVVASTRESV